MATYTLFGQPAAPATLTSDATPYTLGLQFSVSQGATLTGIWFYSAPGGALPQTVALYEVTGPVLVTSQAASWSGAAGSGWVFAALSASLAASTAYKACVLQDTAANWYAGTAGYWTSGPGAGGITSGPLSAPGNASAANGQENYNTGGTLTYPASGGGASYWIDVEVSSGAGVSQVTSGTAGTNEGYATLAFEDAPAAGDLILFLVAANHAPVTDIITGPGVSLLLDSGGIARVYYTWFQAGQNASWAIGVPGGTCSVIAYDITTGGPLATPLDSVPAWLGNFTVGTGEGESEPTVTTTSGAGGGLAVSFLAFAGGTSLDVTDGAPWDAQQSLASSDALVYSDTAPAVASSAMTAAWTVTGTYFFNNGVVLVIPAFAGTGPPSPSAGAAQFAPAFASVTLTGTPGFAAGHSGTVQWSWPQGTPPVTSGATTDTATVADIGAPQAVTTYTYTFTATQDDGQVAAATAQVAVAPPANFRAFGSPVDITFVQVAHETPSPFDADALSVPIVTTAGNTLVVGVVAEVGLDTALALASITDTGDNTWQFSASAVSQSPPANGSYYTLNGYYGFAAIGYVVNAASTGPGGSVTVTLNEVINTASNGALSVVVYEFAGTPSGSVLDAASSGANTFSSAITQAVFTEGNVEDIVVVAASSNSGFSSASAGYVLGPAGNTAYGLVSSPGSQSATLNAPFDTQMNGWCILAIGNPSFEGIGWYGDDPVKRASGGLWV